MDINISNVTTGGFSMDYFSFGTGEIPFIMLPGLYTKPMNTLAQAVAGAYKMFSEKFTVYVLDRRTPISESYTIMDTADDTAAVLDKLNIKKACVFGVSMGGMTAQALAVKRPDRRRHSSLTALQSLHSAVTRGKCRSVLPRQCIRRAFSSSTRTR